VSVSLSLSKSRPVFVNHPHSVSSFVSWPSGTGAGPYSAVPSYDWEHSQSIAVSQSIIKFVYVFPCLWYHCEHVCGLVTTPHACPTPLSPKHSAQFQLQQESDDGPPSTQGYCCISFPSVKPDAVIPFCSFRVIRDDAVFIKFFFYMHLKACLVFDVNALEFQ
jgi:hypothetical protein